MSVVPSRLEIAKYQCSQEKKLYRTWINIHTRCNNINSKDYPRYGGRGISVCNEWNTYEPFRLWATTNGYVEGLHIDRIDNNKGYSAHNCRFVSPLENAQNTRSCVYITAWGETKTTSAWARDSRCTVTQAGLSKRLARGLTGEYAISAHNLKTGECV